MQAIEIFSEYDVVLCDIDGVLHVGPQLIEGVPELLATVQKQGPEVFFITNNGTALPEQIVSGLQRIGLQIPLERLITAGQVLEEAFRTHDLIGRLILSIGNQPAAEYVRRAGGEVLDNKDARQRYSEAAAVVIGSSRELNKDVIDASCNAIYRHNVPVFCTNPDVFTPVGGGEITLVAGAIAGMLQRELNVEVEYLGKPHRPIFEVALKRVQSMTSKATPRVLVVDDNLKSGIRGGINMGFDTMLVLSGWHRSSEEAERVMQEHAIKPTYVLQSVVSE